MNEYHVKIRGKIEPDVVLADELIANDDLKFFVEPRGKPDRLVACYASGTWESVVKSDEMISFRDTSDSEPSYNTHATTGPEGQGEDDASPAPPEPSTDDRLRIKDAFLKWWEYGPGHSPVCEELFVHHNALLMESLDAYKAGWAGHKAQEPYKGSVAEVPPEEDKSSFISPEHAAKICRGHKTTYTCEEGIHQNCICEELAKMFDLMGEY